MSELDIKPEPCLTCPYRKDVPSGVWDREEYEKLRLYDDVFPMQTAIFLCHGSRDAGHDIACKGWVMVHQDSIAVRLAQSTGKLSFEAFTPTVCKLHKSGNAAADFGERDLKRPKRKALTVIRKLTDRKLKAVKA